MEAGELELKKDIPMTEGEILGLEGHRLDCVLGVLDGMVWLDMELQGSTTGYLLVSPYIANMTEFRRCDPPDTSRWSDEDCKRAARIPRYHSSLDAIRPVVEKCVEECGPSSVKWAIEDVQSHEWRTVPGCSHQQVWLATATQLCRAVLIAYSRPAAKHRDISVPAKALEPEKPTSQGDQKESPERP